MKKVKRKVSFLAMGIIAVLGLGFSGCPISGEPFISEYSNSGCLDDSSADSAEHSSSADAQEYPWCGEDEVRVTVEGSSIYVSHLNATYNCCPDDIEVALSAENNKLKLTEEEILTMPCDCLCCYNVETEVAGLMPGIYALEVCWDDYEEGEELCDTLNVVVTYFELSSQAPRLPDPADL